MTSWLAVGVMSGTSLDGLDAVLIEAKKTPSGYQVKEKAHSFQSYSKQVQQRIRRISQENLLREATYFSSFWSDLVFGQVRRLLNQCKIPAHRLHVIGIHGQTLAHHPKPIRFLQQKNAITIQAANLSQLAAKTGITVVGNFRLSDIAMGGQGAPLAPYGHRLLFSQRGKRIAVQNLGGIGNVTLINGNRIQIAFDTGPANLWIDTIIRWKSQGKTLFDKSGKLARKGKVHVPLLENLLSHPYFKKKPPKSAGWEQFGEKFLKKFERKFRTLSTTDSLATVTHATAIVTAQAYKRFLFPKGKPHLVILSGGGAKNRFLVELLKSHLPQVRFVTSQEFGIEVDHVEAICFALFGIETLKGNPIHEPQATGAKQAVICGEIALGANPRHMRRLRARLLR